MESPDGPAVRYSCVLHKQTNSSLTLRQKRLPGNMPTWYGLASDFIAGMEVPIECMSNEAISRMGRASGIGINPVRHTKRKSRTMTILYFFSQRD